MKETDPPQVQIDRSIIALSIYRDMVEEMQEAGFPVVTLQVLREVHQDLRQGKSRQDVIGRAIEGRLQERPGR